MTDREPDDEPKDWRTADQRTNDIAQANALREQAAKGGMRCEVYLVPGLAEWVLDLVVKEVFTDPCEAIFVFMQDQQELARHPDMRKELLNRKIQRAFDDPRPGIPAKEVLAQLEAKMRQPRPEPAVWQKQKYE